MPAGQRDDPNLSVNDFSHRRKRSIDSAASLVLHNEVATQFVGTQLRGLGSNSGILLKPERLLNRKLPRRPRIELDFAKRAFVLGDVLPQNIP
jgi:hypothetical protein